MFCELPIRVDSHFQTGISCTQYNHRDKKSQLMAYSCIMSCIPTVKWLLRLQRQGSLLGGDSRKSQHPFGVGGKEIMVEEGPPKILCLVASSLGHLFSPRFTIGVCSQFRKMMAPARLICGLQSFDQENLPFPSRQLVRRGPMVA